MSLVRACAIAGAALMVGPACLGPGGEDVLVQTWRGYQKAFIRHDGRVVDPRRALTTSEGQAYALVRALWARDKKTFSRVLRWTEHHLQDGDPHSLPAWHWESALGPIGSVRDSNSASDADVWIAYALLLAADTWQEPEYRARALGMLPRIWEEDVARLGQRLVLLPGSWALDENPVRFNPSYVLPFALRRFDHEDPSRAWGKLLDDSYTLLDETTGPSGLPPDWAWLDPLTGLTVTPPADQQDMTRFGFEAFRVPWNLAADLAWHQEPRARLLLDRMAPLAQEFTATGQLPAVRTPKGQAVEPWPYLGLYGCLLPAWGLTEPALAQRLIDEVIEPSRNGRIWGDPSDYYAQNLLWLGLALHLSGPKLPGQP